MKTRMKQFTEFFLSLLFVVSQVVACAPHTGTYVNNGDHKAGATIGNSYTTQATWWIDPLNTSGLAADSNTGLTNTTPLLSWTEVISRWGTPCPRLRQATTVTLMSSQAAGDADVLYPCPSIENNGGLYIEGVPSAVASGTLSSVTAFARPSTWLSATLTSGLAIEELIVNTTHASVAWLYHNTSGNIWQITQPMTAYVVGTTIGDETSGSGQQRVNTWMNGDSYTVYSLPSLQLATASAVLEYSNPGAGSQNSLTVYRVHVTAPTSSPFHQLRLGDGVMFAESVSDRVITGLVSSGASPPSLEGLYNSWAYGGVMSTNAVDTYTSAGVNPSTYSIIAGALGHNGGGASYINRALLFSNVVWTGSGSFSVLSGGAVSAVFLDGTFLIVNGNVSVNNFGSVGAANTGFSGTGEINVACDGLYPCGTIHYDLGASLAGTYFQQTGGLLLDGLTTAYKISGTTFTSGTAVTTSNLDSIAGASKGGVFSIPLTASITNY